MALEVLHAEHITKHFGRTIALNDVSISIGRSEIVALLGQNGSGKSTLTKIIVGVEKLDSGKVTFCDSFFAPKNAAEAARKGISTAYQESATVPDLLVYQWMYLAHELRNSFGVLRVSEMRRSCDSILREFGIPCSPDDRIRKLPMVTRKMIEIAKAMWLARKGASSAGLDSTLIILDEPTAPLSDNERTILFGKLREIKDKSSFLFISHIIPEVLEIADKIYVLRDGKNSGFFDLHAQRTTEQMVYEAMFGTEISRAHIKSAPEKSVPKVKLKLSRLGLQGAFSEISFDLNDGEILSIDGALHSGKMELAKALVGILPHDEGTIEIRGKPIKGGAKSMIRAGVGYFSGDRSDELFMTWPVAKNISITVLDSLRRTTLFFPELDFGKESNLAQGMIKELGIQPQRVDLLVKSLSGGNAQKVGLAKWLCRNPDVLVLVNPTAGIDTKAKNEIHQILLGMRKEGKSVILVSEDAEEIQQLSDRIVKMHRGKVSEIQTGKSLS